MMLISAVVLLFAILLITTTSSSSSMSFFVSAAYVRLETSKPVCFIEETSFSGEQIYLQYTRRDYTRTQNQYIHLEAFDPITSKAYYTKELKAHSGTAVIKSVPTRIGPYTICISSPMRDALNGIFKFPGYEDALELEVLIDHEGRRLPIKSAKEHHAAIRKKVHVDGQREDDEVFTFTDETGHAVSSLRSHDYLDHVETRINLIERQIEQVSAESKYFLRRQAEMRSTSESTFSRIWGLSVLVMVVLVCMSFVQMYSLRRFFKARKIA